MELDRVQDLLAEAESDCRRVPDRDWAWLLEAALATAVAFILAWIALRGLGWIDSTIVQPGSLVATGVSVYTAIAFRVLTIQFLWRRELGRRKDICMQGLSRCRSMLQIIDSHITSKNLCDHWNVRASNRAFAPREAERRPYHEPEIALEYLALAASLTRIVATIAALYPQALPSEADVGSAADGVVRHALDLDRNCMMLAGLVREGASARGWVPIDLPRAGTACAPEVQSSFARDARRRAAA